MFVVRIGCGQAMKALHSGNWKAVCTISYDLVLETAGFQSGTCYCLSHRFVVIVC